MRQQSEEFCKKLQEVEASRAAIEQEANRTVTQKEEDCKLRISTVENEMRDLLRIMDEQKDRHASKMQQVAVLMQSLQQS